MPARHYPPAIDRFMEKVHPIPEAGCWLWSGANARGYGYLRVGGKQTYTHRFSWEQFRGPIPEGMDVLHRCDTPACVNPDHLFVGTHQENMIDMVRKGRGVTLRGEASFKAKLTATDVFAIRASKENQRDMAKKYGVSQAAISRIVRREAWQHI